jgi:tRNA (guanine37-N1)-methyltransferase
MKNVNENRKIPQDLIGDIAILKFSRGMKEEDKKKLALDFLEKNRQIKTIFEKTGKTKGRLRKAEIKFLAGEKKDETIYKENGCVFKFNVRETYFSPRLSWNRQVVACDILKKVKSKKNKILVMFAGIAPYSIVIAKYLKTKRKKARVISSEINRKACEYAEENVKLNKLQDYVFVIPGDSKKIGEKLKRMKIKPEFDFIAMPRPNLKETFLKEALKLGKKGTRYYYHGFGREEKVRNEIINSAKGKIKNLKLRKAGEIGPREYRFLAEFEKK